MKQLVVNNASLTLAFILVLVAMIISTKEKLHLAKDIIYSIIRAVIQLTIIGYVLKYIFRKFLQCINHKRIQATNRNCEVSADVRHDGSEPLVDVMFGKSSFLTFTKSPSRSVVLQCLLYDNFCCD